MSYQMFLQATYSLNTMELISIILKFCLHKSTGSMLNRSAMINIILF